MNSVSKVFLVVFSSLALSTQAETFVPVKDPECLTNVNGLFTTGGQYLDPNNGVIDDSYSMLVRWQGNIVANQISYDISRFTGFKFDGTTGIFPAPPVAPQAQWQRGQTPEDPTGSPGVQLYCNGGGMLINTWTVPHIEVVGGGYNDMFGYQWSNGNEPDAFVMRNGYGAVVRETELLLQANLGLSWFSTHRGTFGNPGRPNPHGQMALFAYLKDASQPSKAPIAVVINAYDSNAAAFSSPDVDGYVRRDYVGGVWFMSATFNKDTPYTKIDPASGSSQSVVIPTPYDNRFASAPFFRIRIPPSGWRAVLGNINQQICGGPSTCPDAYSNNVSDYRVKYAGIIAEATLFDGDHSGSIHDPSKDQVSLGAHFHDFGIYRAY